MTRNTEKPDKPAGNTAAESVIAFQLSQFDRLNEVVKVAFDGALAVVTRQSQAMSELHRQFAELMSHAAGPSAMDGGAASGMASGVVFAQKALGTGISHSIALTEIAIKMEMDALAILNKSVSASLDGALAKISGAKG